MLAKQHRLHRSADFVTTLKQGTRAGRPTLTVHVRLGRDDELGPVRAGLVVSRAVGNAVVRHRVSRQLRHLLGRHVEGPQALPTGSDIVVRASPAAALAGSELLATDLAGALASAVRKSVPR